MSSLLQVHGPSFFKKLYDLELSLNVIAQKVIVRQSVCNLENCNKHLPCRMTGRQINEKKKLLCVFSFFEFTNSLYNYFLSYFHLSQVTTRVHQANNDCTRQTK